MFIKKRATRLFSIIYLLTLSLILFGCSTKDRPIYLKLGAGGTGGSFYPVGIGISRVVERHTNFRISVEATKASVENSRLLNEGEIDLGMVNFPTSIKAFRGDKPFDKAMDLSVLFQLYETPVHIIVMKNSGIIKLEDLHGKRISIGVPGSGNVEVAYAFFEGLLGWEEGIDYKPVYLTYSESVEAFKTGQIDAAIFDTVHPSASIIELSSWKPITLLEVYPELIMDATGPYASTFTEKTIPGGIYNGVDDEVKTIGHGNWLLVRKDFNEDYAYDILTQIFGNLDEFSSSHIAISELTVEIGSKTGGLPLHKGAERFFKEHGITN